MRRKGTRSRHPAEAHVRQILQPFEVRDGDAARIGEDIRNDHDAFLSEHVIGVGRGRSVGAFQDDLRFDPCRVLACEHVFERGRDEDVALELERIRGSKNIGRAWKAQQRAGALPVIEDLVFVQPLRIVNRPLALGDCHEDGSLLAAEFRRVIAHVTEALHHEALALEPNR